MDTEAKYAKLQQTMQDYAAWVRSSARHVLGVVGVAGHSVVDFGCGQGDWLLEAQDLGANHVLGLDSYAIDGTALPVPVQRVDLTKPVLLPDRHDLALCLEVGEHLNAEYAAVLVQSLVAAAPLVLFSAAVPGQGGVHHVNEQPPAYWAALFRTHGYRCFDFRHQIWNNGQIEPWYRMGVLVFASPGHIPPHLGHFETEAPLHLVHPDIFQAYAPLGRDLVLHYDRNRQRWFPEMLG